MPAKRYAGTVTFPLYEVDPRNYGTDGYFQHLKSRLRNEVGSALLVELESMGNQALVRMDWREDFLAAADLGRLTLQVEISGAVFVRDWHVPAPDQWGMAVSVPREKPVIEWQCGHCGQVNLVAEHLDCRKCGAPRKVMR